MPDKTKVQIEDWHQDLPSLHVACDTLAAYPVCKQPAIIREFVGVNGFRRSEYPERYRNFRLALQFPCVEDAETAYNKLLNGEANLLDYSEYMQEKKYAVCI